MTRACPGPRPITVRPRWQPPAGTTDCHMHVFGPFDRYPLAAGRSYTPPEASLSMYGDVCAALGIQRTVVVQPSVYGSDNSLVLDTVASSRNTRAVVVVDASVTDAELSAMARRGACGLRFNAVFGGGSLDQLPELAARVRPMGWHVELYCNDLAALEPLLLELGVPVVLDHMGGIQAAESLAALIRLLQRGAWVKLCGYRSALGYDDLTAMARAMIAAAPSRCVWGTDWPHPALHTPADVPDDGHLMNLLGEWAPDEATRRAILVDNPARLYGFYKR